MQGVIFIDRLLARHVARACERLGYEFKAFSDDWVLRIRNGDKQRWIIGYTFDINGAGAVGVATDKVATSLSLSDEGIPVFQHYLARILVEQGVLPGNLLELDEREPVVIKPLAGSGGRGVRLMTNKTAALDYIESSLHPDWAISPLYEVMSEKRAIMLDGRILCSYEKTQPHEQDGLKMFNLSQGASAVNCTLSDDEQMLAARALKASGLRAAAVDVATLQDGSLMIIEVNSGVTMGHYASLSQENFEIAAGVYFEMIKAMMS